VLASVALIQINSQAKSFVAARGRPADRFRMRSPALPGVQVTRPYKDKCATVLVVAQPLWEMTGGLLAMDIRTGEG
jgi:hypothetical protein